MRTIARLASRPGAGGGKPLTRGQARRLREMVASNDRERMVEACQAMGAFDSHAWLSRIRAPTMVVCGSDDTAVPMSHTLTLASGIAGAEIRVVQGAGHALVWTHPRELCQMTTDWLSPSRRSGR